MRIIPLIVLAILVFCSIISVALNGINTTIDAPADIGIAVIGFCFLFYAASKYKGIGG